MQSIKPRRQIARQTRPLQGNFLPLAASKLCQPKFGRCIRMKKLLAAVWPRCSFFHGGIGGNYSQSAIREGDVLIYGRERGKDESFTPVRASGRDRFLLICFEDAGTQTYALLGAGDGTQAFNAFAPESGTYETRFAGFWAAVSQLEPALTLDGKATSLAFLLGGNGNGLLVSLGGTIIAELNGTQAFLIASDSIASEAVSRAAGCDLRVWTPEGVSGAETNAASNLCPRCGQVDDGSAKHQGLPLFQIQQPHHLRKVRRTLVLQGARRPQDARLRAPRLPGLWA